MIEYIKAKNWDGKDLKGVWLISYKVDGVRAIYHEGQWVSRNGKPLYNLQEIPPEYKDVEVYHKDWATSVSMVRTKNSTPVPLHCARRLDDDHCQMLLAEVEDPTAEEIDTWLQTYLEAGYEGLVLRQGDTWLKVKPLETYDVRVTGIKEGTGRNKGRLGALLTEMGNVGTGFSDEQREQFFNNPPDMIEVECMELTPSGKFRHPRFVRERWDK